MQRQAMKLGVGLGIRLSVILFFYGFSIGQTLWPVETFLLEGFPIGITVLDLSPRASPDQAQRAKINCHTYYKTDSTTKILADQFCAQERIDIPIENLRAGDSLLMYFRHDYVTGISSAEFDTVYWSTPSETPKELGGMPVGQFRTYSRIYVYISGAHGGSTEYLRQVWRIALLENNKELALRKTRWQIALKEAWTLNVAPRDSVFDRLATHRAWDTTLITPADSPFYFVDFGSASRPVHQMAQSAYHQTKAPFWLPSDRSSVLAFKNPPFRDYCRYDNSGQFLGRLQPLSSHITSGFQYYQPDIGLIWAETKKINRSEDHEYIRLLDYGIDTLSVSVRRLLAPKPKGYKAMSTRYHGNSPIFATPKGPVNLLGRPAASIPP